jgi:hypothetical protein
MICILQKILVSFNMFSFLAYFDKRPYTNRLLSKLDNVVRPVHVHKDLLFLKLDVFVLHNIIEERSLAPSEMAAQNQKFTLIIVPRVFNNLWVHRLKEASINCMLPSVLIARIYCHPLLALNQVQHLYFPDITGTSQFV